MEKVLGLEGLKYGQRGEAPTVTEEEREATERALKAKGMASKSGQAGGSPYSCQTVVFSPGPLKRGDRVRWALVVKSFDGEGRYKGRGRWRNVVVLSQHPEGESAICSPTDRGAEQVGYSGVYLRSWGIAEEEASSGGLGHATQSLGAALAALGLK